MNLKVVSYYDSWLKEGKKAVLLEKDGNLYDASGLFSKLEDFEINNMENVCVLYEEKINYCDRSVEEQVELLEEVQRLEKVYNIEPFGGLKAKCHWVYVNGVSHIKAYQ